MRKHVEQLKPKANKLLSFVTNWQLAKPEKNIELSKALNDLIKIGVFPSPIRVFFKLPQFKKLLNTMEHEGKLFIMPQMNEVELDESHPPIEIQNIQILVEALHKLVHLDYNTLAIKEPAVQAKVLGDNILEYLSAVSIFVPFESKFVDEILEYLFKALRKHSEKLKSLVEKNPNAFSPTLIHLIKEPIFNLLLHIDRKSHSSYVIEDWHPILVELNIDAKLSHLTKQLKDITSANAHKLLNQIKCLLDEKRQFYQRNLPRYVPKKLKEQALEKLTEFSHGEPILGQRINELFYNEFRHQRYEVIEARQLGINNKFQSYADKMWPMKKSLISLIEQYHHNLPDQFCSYFKSNLPIFSQFLSILGKPNHLAVQLTTGFYSTQLDYLSDMLTEDNSSQIIDNLQNDIENIMPVIHSFFETYYSLKPKPSFKTIRSTLENIYLGNDALKMYSIEEVGKRIDEVFSQLLPSEGELFTTIEGSLSIITSITQEITKKLPKDSIENRLLSPILSQLINMDLPSYSQSWYVFGSLLSVFYVILSRQDIEFDKTIEVWMSRMKNSNFFQMMFYQS